MPGLRSELDLKLDEQYCSTKAGMQSTVKQLAAYAQGKPVQQALAVNECAAASTPKATSRTMQLSGHRWRGQRWSVTVLPDHAGRA
jgi:hypothetical protein